MKAIGSFETSRKNSFGAWYNETVEVLSVSAPENIRGRVTGANWSVAFEVPSVLGNTGRQTRHKYFARKDEALNWMQEIV